MLTIDCCGTPVTFTNDQVHIMIDCLEKSKDSDSITDDEKLLATKMIAELKVWYKENNSEFN